MDILYSNILPLGTEKGQKTVNDCLREQFQNANQVKIAVGYVSAASLDELDQIAEEKKIQNISVTMGMYYTEGMNERTYHKALKLNRKWKNKGIGEIRLVQPFKYHGKVFCFYKNGVPFSAILGSANLGVLKLEASNRRQYELSVLIQDPSVLNEIAKHIDQLESKKCSSCIDNIDNIPLIREANTALDHIEQVKVLPPAALEFYKQCEHPVSFQLDLKVPREAERFLDDGKHYTKSNINVCYAAPRSKRKNRDWYEMQLTVGSSIYRMEGYPKKNVPFFIATDDGYWFKAHTTSDNNKQFSAVGDELIMGRWLKGRLAAAGIVTPVNDTALDKERLGMITKEMLDEYGCDKLLFQKTDQKAHDEDGELLDIWLLSFIEKKKE